MAVEVICLLKRSFQWTRIRRWISCPPKSSHDTVVFVYLNINAIHNFQSTDCGLSVFCQVGLRPGDPDSLFTTGTGRKFHGKLANNLPAFGESSQPTHERSKVSYQCTDCAMRFKSNSLLWYHVRTTHSCKRFACPQCSCTFASKGGLNQHVRHTHLKLSRYNCQLCGKGYSDRSNLHDHIATHTGARRNVCPICQKQFTFKPGLKAHMLHFHPNEVSRDKDL